jgi:hypothetical protein
MGFLGRLKRPAGSIDYVDDGAKVKLPTLEDFRDAIIGSINSKSKDKSIPIIQFIRQWKHLERGWLREILAPGNSSSRLSADEKLAVTYLSPFLCGGRMDGYADELSFCFDVSANTIRKIAQEGFNKFLPSGEHFLDPSLENPKKRRPDLAYQAKNSDLQLVMEPLIEDIQEETAIPALLPDGDLDTEMAADEAIYIPPSPIILKARFDECMTPLRDTSTAMMTTPNNQASGSSLTSLDDGLFKYFVNSAKKMKHKLKRRFQHAASVGKSNLTNSVQKIRRRYVLARPARNQESQTEARDSESQDEHTASQTESSPESLSQALKLVNHILVTENDPDAEVLKQINALAVKILEKSAIYNKDDGLIRVKYTVPTKKGQTTKTKVFAGVPVANKVLSRMESNKKDRQKQIERRAARTNEVLKSVCPTVDDRQDVLSRLVKDVNGSVVWKPFFLDIADIIAVRLKAGGTAASTNMILRVLGAAGKLLGVDNFLAPQAKKRIGDFERNALPVEFKMATCNIAAGKEAACVYYWIPNQPLLIEMMVCASIVDGKQQPSTLFSSFEDFHVWFAGIDRGGGDLISMIRNGNREGGNTAEYSIPIAVVEGGSEDLATLKKTVLEYARAIVVQSMMDGKLSMVEIHVSRDIRCICIELASAMKIKTATVGLLEDEVFESVRAEGYKTFLSDSVHAEKREVPDAIDVPPDSAALDSGTLTLSLQMVRVKTEEEQLYVGCRFPDLGYSFKFADPISLGQEETTSLDEQEKEIAANWKPMICFPSHDGKMITHVNGLGNCSVTYPCPRCIRRKDCRSLPAWGNEFPELVEGLVCEDFPVRKGRFSFDVLERLSKQKLGSGREYSHAEKESTIPPAVIEATKSVNSEILQYLDPDMVDGDGMHVSQGYMTHLTVEVAVMLAGLFTSGGWAEKNEAVMKEKAEELVRMMDSEDYSNARKRDNACKRKYVAKEKELQAVMDECANDEDELEDLKLAVYVLKSEVQESEGEDLEVTERWGTAKKELAQFEDHMTDAAIQMADFALELEDLAEKREIESEDSGFGFMNRLIKGGKEMLSLIENGATNKRLRKLNKPEYLFLQSIRKYAGSFNKQHGSMELTHGRGMNALEHREKIHALTCGGIQDDEELQKQITTLMDWWLRVAGYLFEISAFMKSQKKVTDERLKEFKRNLLMYGIAWREKITYKNPVFWKMHVAECCFVARVSWTRFSGRGDTQGFENKHHEMSAMKAMLKPMIDTGQRVSKQAQRQQIHLFRDISARMEQIEEKTKRTGPRGPYKTKGKSSRAQEDVDALEAGDELEKAFFELESGGLLRAEMSTFYNFYKRSHMPEEWYEPIQSFSQLGSKAKNEMKYNDL